MTKKLLLVDDHPLFRRGVKELILRHSSLYGEVIEADDGHEALVQIDLYAPDCVMLDIAMPELDGLRALEMIRRNNAAPPCIMLSMYDNPEFVVQARALGAMGYILKTDSDAVILECLEAVEKGQRYVSAGVSNNTEPLVPETKVGADQLDQLSKREKEVLSLIAINQTSKEIAQRLSLSLRTVQNHRLNICKKLGLSGPNALLKTAIENQAWLSSSAQIP